FEFHLEGTRRTMNFQRTANRGLTGCQPWVHRNLWRWCAGCAGRVLVRVRAAAGCAVPATPGTRRAARACADQERLAAQRESDAMKFRGASGVSSVAMG